LKTEGWRKNEPGLYRRVDDSYWGVESADTDRVVIETQGIIYDRSREHLAASDRGVIMLRQIIKESIEAVRQGRDPVGVIREPRDNELVRFDASMDEIGPLA
jgi:hypothetical protein